MRTNFISKIIGAVFCVALGSLFLGCDNKAASIQNIVASPLELSVPQESFALGYSYYSIRFNQEIKAMEGQTLENGIFLRFGDENFQEGSPQSAATEFDRYV